jgi:hypothetical protein
VEGVAVGVVDAAVLAGEGATTCTSREPDQSGPSSPTQAARARGPEALDGCVEGMGQVRQSLGLGEHLDRGAVAVPGDQAKVDVVAALARPVQIREQAGGVAGALQVSDHGVYLEGEWRTGARVVGPSGREDPQIPRFGPAGDGW